MLQFEAFIKKGVFMKAFYCLWPNYDYIDKLVDAGIDTILLTAHDLPWEKESGYYDSKKLVIDTAIRYRGKCKIFLVPLWIRDPNYYSIPELEQWRTEDGRYLSKTPCPTSTYYISGRVLPAIQFCHEYQLDGIIWDLEHLIPSKYVDKIIPFYKDKNPEKRCHCVVCKNYNLEDLWKVHAGLIKGHLDQSGILVHGQMPYSYGWTMRQYPEQVFHFTEETYEKDISWIEQFKWDFSYWKYNVSPNVVPGIWCEFLKTEENLIKYIKQLYKKYKCFWLYSHEYFGNRIPNPHVNYPMPGPATDWFFERLREI